MNDKKPEVKKDTKKAKATVIIAKHHAKMTTKELVSELMTHCGLSDFGARTYVYNIRKELKLEAPPRQVAAKKAPPATAKKKSDATKPDAKAKKKKSSAKKGKTEAKGPASDEAMATKADAANAINEPVGADNE